MELIPKRNVEINKYKEIKTKIIFAVKAIYFKPSMIEEILRGMTINLLFKHPKIIFCHGYFFGKIKQNEETDDDLIPSHEEQVKNKVNIVMEYSSFGSVKEKIIYKKTFFQDN